MEGITKLPWNIVESPKRQIVGADGALVANLTALDLPNAEFIVLACSAYAPLTEALQWIQRNPGAHPENVRAVVSAALLNAGVQA